jgi:hypothetical protein
MATASVTHTFAALTDIKSSEANKNFGDLVTFLNNQVIHADASRPFTSHPSGPPTDPTSDNQYARKAYVDRGPTLVQQEFTPGGTSDLTVGTFVNWPSVGGQFTMSHTKKLASTNICVIYMGSGYAVTAAATSGEYAVRIDAAGSDFVLTRFYHNTLSEHHTFAGAQTIAGVGVGAHTYGLRARRSSGTGAIRTDANDRQQFIVIEVP